MGRYTGKIRNLMIPVKTRDCLKELAHKYNTSMSQVVSEIVITLWQHEFGDNDSYISGDNDSYLDQIIPPLIANTEKERALAQ